MANETEQRKKFDGKSFFIFNKVYDHAKIGITQGKELVTYEPTVFPDQIWLLEESSSHPGYYYIKNAHYGDFRLSVLPFLMAFGIKKPVANNSNYNNYDLWKLQQFGGYYRLYNYGLSHNYLLAKNGGGDEDLVIYNGAHYEDQLWKFVPRFEATVNKRNLVWEIDNRQGSEPIPRAVKVTVGVKTTSSKSISTTIGFETSLKASVAGVDAEAKFSSQITSSLSHSEEKYWSTEVTTTYTAPPRKKYGIYQTVVDFNSPLAADNCALFSSVEVEESS